MGLAGCIDAGPSCVTLRTETAEVETLVASVSDGSSAIIVRFRAAAGTDENPTEQLVPFDAAGEQVGQTRVLGWMASGSRNTNPR